ncbi:MAG: hypothetical protein QOF30_737 [Acidimicrobiaceae bacterium]|nr:hypothetical protein [Acidimicrobiaceae bacterium]
MLLTAAVVPGPPALVAELMGSAAHELDDLRDAAEAVVNRALCDLLASRDAPSPQLVVVGPGTAGESNAAGPLSFAGFGRDVLLPALVQGQQGDAELPTPIMVARYLAARDIAAHAEHAQLWASARWVTTGGADAVALGKQLGAEGTAVGLILVADGAACHGPKAPRAQDPRAKAYDAAVWAALATGEPSRLAQIDADLGDELGATGPQVWPVLVAAAGAAATEAVGEVVWAGAPYGVGWAVASWRRCQ